MGTSYASSVGGIDTQQSAFYRTDTHPDYSQNENLTIKT